MLNIDKKLYSDIKAYCKVNSIDDVDKFCGNLLEKAFTSEKYGAVPNIVPTKDVEKKIEEPLVYDTNNVLPLQNVTTELVEENKEEENKEEQPKEEPKKEEPPKKIFKKVNLNDDYKIYDI